MSLSKLVKNDRLFRHLRSITKSTIATTSAPVHESFVTSGIAHVRGRTDVELPNWTLGKLLEDHARTYSSKEVLRVVQQDVRWSWTELEKRANAFALGLSKLGFEKGDRLGIWLPNCSEWVVAKFAAAKLGVIIVNINPAYRLYELEHAINLVGVKGLILKPHFKLSDYVPMLLQLCPEIPKCPPGQLHSPKVPSLRTVIVTGDERFPGMINFDDIYSESDSQARELVDRIRPSVNAHDPINIQFTSGTTGLPKGATLTHANIVNNGYLAGLGMKLTPQDRLCVPVPLYHCFGLVLGNLAFMMHGGSLVYPAMGFDTLATLQAVSQEKCTALHGVPTMFIAELHHPQFHTFDVSSLRTGIMAGSPCPIEVMKQVMSQMHLKDMTIVYGMTETSPGSFQSTTDTPIEKRVSTVGRVMPHTECKVVDKDGNICPVGVPGELLVKGYLVMQGYWNNPEKTKDAITEDGFMRTGDLATIDAEGYCSIVGREKDTIIRGGENISPREVEEYLYQHPKVADVQVIGVPDEKYGQQVCAWIIPKKGQTVTPQEIKEFCHDKIAHYKIPHYILFVEKYPMTITGKIQKFIMRDETIKILGLDATKGDMSN